MSCLLVLDGVVECTVDLTAIRFQIKKLKLYTDTDI